MACQHVKYTKHNVPGDPPIEYRVCDACGQEWAKHDGELRFAGDVVSGATAVALLTPRDERS